MCVCGINRWWLGLLKLASTALSFTGPILLHGTLQFLQTANQNAWTGLLWASGLVLSAIFSALFAYVDLCCTTSHRNLQSNNNVCRTQFGWRASRIQLRLRSSLITAVLYRTLVVHASELNSFTTGAVTNMMSVDVQKVCRQASTTSSVKG